MRHQKHRSLGITVSDILFVVFIGAVMYGSYLYVPLIYKSQELKSLAKDYTFKTGTAQAGMIREAVVEDAQYKLGVTLNPDDVIVVKDDNRTKIQISWTPIIELPFNVRIPKKFVVEYDRRHL